MPTRSAWKRSPLTTADTHEEIETTAAIESTVEPTAALATQTPEAESDQSHRHAAPAMNPDLTRTVAVEAPAEDVDQAFRKVVKRYSKLARIPGFRSGKVPDSLIRSRFGKEIRQEVLESLVAERFRTELEKDSLSPVSQPQLSELQLTEGQPLRFRATFEILPTIDVDGYDTVTVQKPDVTVTDEEYGAELNALLDQHATVEAVEEDRAAADGDWAEISFGGRMHPDTTPDATPDSEGAGVQQPEATEQPEATDQPEIKGEDILLEVGGKNTLPAFSDALRGATVGQEMSFEVVYPADFGDARLAGKTVSYDLKVTGLKRKTPPERNDEFAKGMGAYDTWQEFEDKLRERITERKQESLETEARDKMLDELIARFQFPVPEFFVQQQIDVRLDRGLRALAQQGMSQDQMRQLDFARLREAQREQALAEVKASLILDRIAERENVSVSEDEMERELLMASLQAREPLETLRKRLNDDGSLGRIREQMRREKTGAALYEKLAS